MTFSYTLLLVVITSAVSLYAYENRTWFERLEFRPYRIKHGRGEQYRFLSYAFVHADFMHLLFNMFVLYMFGNLIEGELVYLYGNKGLYYYILLYFGGTLFAAIPSMVKHKDNVFYAVIGASGATSALVFSFIALHPMSGLSPVFLNIPIPAIYYGAIILLAEYFLSKRGGTNIAHDAHIYGAIYGFVFTLLIERNNFNQFIHEIQSAFQ